MTKDYENAMIKYKTDKDEIGIRTHISKREIAFAP